MKKIENSFAVTGFKEYISVLFLWGEDRNHRIEWFR